MPINEREDKKWPLNRYGPRCFEINPTIEKDEKN